MFGVQKLHTIGDFSGRQKYEPYMRSHLYTASIAIMMTWSVFKSKDIINDKKLSEFEEEKTALLNSSGRGVIVKESASSSWGQFSLAITLNAARFTSFIWAYMYHDWQALILLTFIAHSTIYQGGKRFQNSVAYLYIPYATLLALF
jgi:hypothetical protein